MTILKDFISETAFAQLIGRHPATVERWRKNGFGPPFVMLDKVAFCRISAITKWLAEQEQASGLPPKTKRLTGHLQARRTAREPRHSRMSSAGIMPGWRAKQILMEVLPNA